MIVDRMITDTIYEYYENLILFFLKKECFYGNP